MVISFFLPGCCGRGRGKLDSPGGRQSGDIVLTHKTRQHGIRGLGICHRTGKNMDCK